MLYLSLLDGLTVLLVSSSRGREGKLKTRTIRRDKKIMYPRMSMTMNMIMRLTTMLPMAIVLRTRMAMLTTMMVVLTRTMKMVAVWTLVGGKVENGALGEGDGDGDDDEGKHPDGDDDDVFHVETMCSMSKR